jgi:hypothetical protein
MKLTDYLTAVDALRGEGRELSLPEASAVTGER